MNNLSELEQLNVFRAVRAVLKKHNAEFYLIGAQARDIQLMQHGIKPLRATRDVDIAIKISTLRKYKRIKQELVEHFDFRPYGSEPYRLIHNKTKTVLDLLPFGEIAKAGMVSFDDRLKTKLPVFGIKEVVQLSHAVQIDGDCILNVATLPGIFVLKLLAWHGAPETRRKDVDDLKEIIQHYFELNKDEIYDKHVDLFTEDFEPENVAARVLGRHLHTILKQSARLRKRILLILKESATKPEDSPLGEQMVEGTDWNITAACVILEQILKGIQD